MTRRGGSQNVYQADQGQLIFHATLEGVRELIVMWQDKGTEALSLTLFLRCPAGKHKIRNNIPQLIQRVQSSQPALNGRSPRISATYHNSLSYNPQNRYIGFEAGVKKKLTKQPVEPVSYLAVFSEQQPLPHS